METKLCVNCAHAYKRFGLHHCGATAYQHRDVVTGDVHVIDSTCKNNRARNGECKAEAKLFTPKPENKILAWFKSL